MVLLEKEETNRAFRDAQMLRFGNQRPTRELARSKTESRARSRTSSRTSWGYAGDLRVARGSADVCGGRWSFGRMREMLSPVEPGTGPARAPQPFPPCRPPSRHPSEDFGDPVPYGRENSRGSTRGTSPRKPTGPDPQVHSSVRMATLAASRVRCFLSTAAGPMPYVKKRSTVSPRG